MLFLNLLKGCKMIHFYKTLFILLLSATAAFAQNGGLKVYIENTKKDELFGATVQVMQGEQQIAGGAVDIEGFLYLPNIPIGTYVVVIRHASLLVSHEFEVSISSNTIYELRETINVLAELPTHVVRCDILDDGGGQDTNPGDKILDGPYRSAYEAAALSASVLPTAGGLVMRGGRPDQVLTLVDGIPLIGSSQMGTSAYGEVQVYQSGIPVEFGDATSGIVNITTRRPSAQMYNRLEFITSEFLDPFGYNTVEFLSTGPLKSKEIDATSGFTIPQLGYMFAGNVNYRKDPNPSPIGLWQVNEDKIRAIEENPLRPSPLGSGFVSQSEFIDFSDMTKVRVKPNTQQLNYNFTGKFDWLVADSIMITVGGRARRSAGNNFSFTNSLLNYQNNSEFTNETYTGFFRLRQDLKSDEGALLQNVSYSFQMDYSSSRDVVQDPTHQQSFFNYGHVGKFDLYQQNYLWQTRQINPNSPHQVSLFALYEVETPFDTAVRFTPGTVNPVTTNYTSQFFKFQNNDVNSLSEIQQNGGLINGMTPQGIYSLWTDVGTPTTSYAKQNENQVSINFSVNASIDKHNLKFGVRYEERTSRFYRIAANNLWSTMRQSVNRHIKFRTNSLDSAIYVFSDGDYFGYELD